MCTCCLNKSVKYIDLKCCGICWIKALKIWRKIFIFVVVVVVVALLNIYKPINDHNVVVAAV